jgi:acyl dehydratase
MNLGADEQVTSVGIEASRAVRVVLRGQTVFIGLLVAEVAGIGSSVLNEVAQFVVEQLVELATVIWKMRSNRIT